MSYEVLARKWRPQVFQDVLGQEHITQTLINAIKSDRLAHAYLFSGARGVGKTSVARILAKAINCREGEPGNPCNKCHSCLEIKSGSSIDVQEIDGASNRGIDEIKELRESIKYMPSSSLFRVYIIDEVHMLTPHAFNALLKTLEEPPPHVKFIFATTDPHKVPVTILSRCQRFDFKRIPLGIMVEQLNKITASEGISINKSGLALIAREAEGSMRDAESLLDQVVSYIGTKVEEKDIRDILGIIDRALIFDASAAIIEGSPKKCLGIVEQIYHYGYDIKDFYRSLMSQFRNLLVSIIAPENELIDMIESDKEELRHLGERAGIEKLQQALNLMIAREGGLRYSSHPRVVLENILIKLCRLGEVLSFNELLTKIKELENRLQGPLSSAQVAPVGHIDDPASQWETKKEEPAPVKNQAARPREQEWQDFLDYLLPRNKAMTNVLREWKIVDITDDTIVIARGNNSFSSSYLDEPERLEKLAGFCKDFFKRRLKIKIVKSEENTPLKKDVSEEKPSDLEQGKSPDLPHPVQEILQIFQGEMKEPGSVKKKEKKTQ